MKRSLILVPFVSLLGCGGPGGWEPRTEPIHVPPPAAALRLESELRAAIEASGLEVGLYYRALEDDPDSVLIDPDLRMHAASTMKVPVMMRLYLDHQEGSRSLDDPLEITRTFRSIVDGSAFDLPPESDSDTTFYGRVGQRAPARQLMERMISWSSNLATNILIQEVGADRVTALLRSLGADSMEVLRGVEDLPAFRAGLSNTATARDLGIVMRTVAEGEIFEEWARREMLAILEDQHFKEKIPGGLPPGTRVANKTGWITGISHDAAVVFPDSAPPYVLVILLRGDFAEGEDAALAARLSLTVWEHHTDRS